MSCYIRKSVRELSGYVPGEQPSDAGTRLIKLNTNENPYPPSPAVGDALASFSVESLSLYPDPDSCELRRVIADFHRCRPENVFAGNGSDEILALCTRAFVENDGVIGFFNPTYSLYSVLARIRGVDTRIQELDCRFDWEMADGFSASLFFLANPNPPAGTRFKKERVRAFCSQFGGVVVIDEAYVAFADADCMDLALEMNNVLVVRTLSKSHSLAGLRLGYAVGPSSLIKALFKIKDSYNLDRITQAVGINAIRDDAVARRNAELIKNTRARCGEELKQMGFEVCPSEANFLWIGPPRMRAEMFCRELRGRNILVRYFPGPRTGSFLRVTIGTDEQMETLLSAVRKIME